MTTGKVRFNRLEVHGVKDHGEYASIVSDREADFFTIFGFVTGINGGEFCMPVGDHATRDEAEQVIDMMTPE